MHGCIVFLDIGYWETSGIVLTGSLCKILVQMGIVWTSALVPLSIVNV